MTEIEVLKNEVDAEKAKQKQELRDANAKKIALKREESALRKAALHSVLSTIAGVLLPFIQILTERPIWPINVGAIILVGYGVKCANACFKCRKLDSYKGGIKFMANIGIAINALIMGVLGVILARIIFHF